MSSFYKKQEVTFSKVFVHTYLIQNICAFTIDKITTTEHELNAFLKVYSNAVIAVLACTSLGTDRPFLGVFYPRGWFCRRKVRERCKKT